MALRKRFPCTIESFNELLNDVIQKRVGSTTAQNAIVVYLQSEEFLQMIFNPPEEIEKTKIQQDTKEMYVLLARRKMLKLIVNAIEDEIYESYDDPFDRSVATFLNTVSIAGIAASHDFEKRLKDDLRDGKLSRGEAREEMEHIEIYNDAIQKLLKTAVHIIKKKAKRLSRASGMPVELCRNGFLLVPSPKYVNKYQIGFYANRVLSDLYETVDEYVVTLDHVDWFEYFSTLFGKNNVVEVANFILLEGMDRINNYRGSAIREVWNDLTKFALEVMEKSPEQVQTQMMDLYTKRIARMFGNNTYELRADLRNLDPDIYPHLTKVIANYADKITEIIKTAASKTEA